AAPACGVDQLQMRLGLRAMVVQMETAPVPGVDQQSVENVDVVAVAPALAAPLAAPLATLLPGPRQIVFVGADDGRVVVRDRVTGGRTVSLAGLVDAAHPVVAQNLPDVGRGPRRDPERTDALLDQRADDAGAAVAIGRQLEDAPERSHPLRDRHEL